MATVPPPFPPDARTGSERGSQILLFGVMLAIAVGNTGLQSVLPAIGRTIGLPDPFVALAFSFSALIWVFAAPFWARRMRPMHARRMVMIGMSGFVGSLLICGAALCAAMLGWLPTGIACILFVLGRLIYGTLGAAAPPAAQAMSIADVPREERTAALSMLASAFGLGTIIGPALAPFFVLPVVGLAGPVFVFAIAGIAMMVTVRSILPEGFTVGSVAPVSDPVIGYEPTDETLAEMEAEPGGASISLFDRRIRPWMA
jgi:MFS family permease